MKNEGPELEILTRHLSECPECFLMEPMMVSPAGKSEGIIKTSAVVFDLLRAVGLEEFTPEDEKNFELAGDKGNRNRLLVIQVAAWLLCNGWFMDLARKNDRIKREIMRLLSAGLSETAAVVRAELFISDPDRREELARFCLSFLGCRPKGESEDQAADRLTTLDSIEQQRIIKKSMEHQKMLEKKREEEKNKRLAEEERQRKIREEMERNDESSKATRE